MSREALSQAEIDALLKSMADEPHVTNILSDEDKNALTEFGNILFGSSATALSTLLGNQVMITTARVAATTKRMLADEVPGRSLVAEMHVTSSFNGVVYLVVEESAVATAAGLMTGGSSVVAALGDAQMPMVRELIGQLAEGGGTALSGLIGSRTNIQVTDLVLRDLATEDLSSQFLPDDMLVKLIFRWQIGEVVDSELLLVMPQGMASGIVAALMGDPLSPAPVLPDAGSGVPVLGVTSPAAAAALAAPPGATAALSRAAAAPAASRSAQAAQGAVTVQPAEFSELPRQRTADGGGNIDLLLDVPLNLTVELGRTKKTIREILSLGPGSVVELEKLAGETVDILVGGKLIAKGEVVVIDENFAVRITDIVSPVDRLNSLR
ncbi:MAG: flagellar motor switch phosphatase FliY [Chloroflexota bacterium]